MQITLDTYFHADPVPRWGAEEAIQQSIERETSDAEGGALTITFRASPNCDTVLSFIHR